MALAMGGGVHLETGERFALTANWGTFEGQYGVGIGFSARVNQHVSFNGGYGAGLSLGTSGGRAGIRIGW